MKTGIFIVLVLAIFTFSSCELTGESNYTPDIYFIHNPVRGTTDTLNRYYTDKSGVFLMDTISVGDTVLFMLYLEAYANNLTAFYLQQSQDSVSEILLPDRESMDSIFLSTSDYGKGTFLLDGTHSALVFPFRYVALKPSNSAKINIAIVSDAHFDSGFGSNTNVMELKTPIIAKTED